MTKLRLPPVFAYAEARAQGLSDRALREQEATGRIERLSHGVYRRVDVETAEIELAEIALRAPKATICLTTALSRHHLTDTIPSTIDIALPQGTWAPRVSAPVSWHKFSRETFEVGREVLGADEHHIGMYGAVRSIVDAFRLRHLEGRDLALEVLKRWLRRRGSHPAELLMMARRVDPRSEVTIRRTLEILL